MRRVAALLVALASALPGRAASAPAEALAVAGARIAGAVDALDGPEAGEDRIAALVEAMATYEVALAGLRGAVIGAEERERALAFGLQRRRGETTRLLAALQAMRRAPPTQALHPAGPLGAARAAAMLAALAPKLEAEADALRTQLAEIEAARALRARGVEEMSAGLVELAAARAALVAALARRAPSGGPTAPVQGAMVRDAETLSALADQLADRPGDAATATSTGAPMALSWPVTGHVLRGYAEPDAAGVRRPGLLLQAAPLSVVTAPADARVRYAGPFLDYGYVVVLEPRADVLIVLAGLATLETRTGAAVREGGLLGLLGGRALGTQEYLMLGDAGTGETPGETLYIELRHGEGSVDPAAWFAERNG